MLSFLTNKLRNIKQFKQKSEDIIIPEHCLGVPNILDNRCQTCDLCLRLCPASALIKQADRISLDLGHCVFCGSCQDVCPQQNISFSQNYRLASFQREHLLISHAKPFKGIGFIPNNLQIFRHSLSILPVSAGACGACASELDFLGTPSYPLGKISFADSPRQADALIISGPVCENMRDALLDTWAAMPEPKIAIALGTCAISGGLFANSLECHDGISNFLPVALYIPGCPPPPKTILHALQAIANANNKK